MLPKDHLIMKLRLPRILSPQTGSKGGLLCLVGAFSVSAQVEITSLPTLGGSVVQATALNNAGQIVGFSRTAGDAAQHAFLFSGGQIYDLGTLGGGFSLARGINAAGQIIGEALTANNAQSHAFLYDAGAMIDLGTLGGSRSFAVAINDAGQVAGDADLPGDAGRNGFLYDGRSLLNLGSPSGAFSSVVALNNLGQVAGNLSLADGSYHAFLFDGTNLQDLGTLGSAYSAASAINDAGLVVGESDMPNRDTHAFVFRDGTMSDLGTLGGGYSTAYAINQSGQVIGDSTTANEMEFHAFVWRDGVMVDLGTLGEDFSTASAINNLGQVVGYSQNSAFADCAFLWQDGVMKDLNSFLPAGSGWVLNYAGFINDAGQIVGYGTYQEEFSWFLLSLNAANHPPVAVAVGQPTVECPNPVVLDGRLSSDPDQDLLTFEWREGSTLLGSEPILSVSLPVGSHLITLTVTDPSGASAQATVAIEVVDTTPPVVVCPPLPTAAADAKGQAVVPDLIETSTLADACSDAASLVKTQDPPAGTLVGLGSHALTLRVADPAGNTATGSATFTVADSTGPVIQSAVVSPNTLNPPNRQMVPVQVTVVAWDNCDPTPAARILSVTSSDPITGVGDKTSPDWLMTGPLTAELRAEPSSHGADRIYTLTIQCADAAGNASITRLPVVVTKPSKH